MTQVCPMPLRGRNFRNGSFLIYFSLGLLLGGLLPSITIAAEPAREVAARVNGEPIYLDQVEPLVDGQLRASRGMRRQAGGDEQVEHLRRRALDQLIEVELLYQAGRHLKVPDAEAQIEKYVEHYRQSAERTGADLSEEQMSAAARRQVYIDAFYQNSKIGEVEVPEEEIRAIYEKGKHSFATGPSAEVRHILAAVSPDAAAEDLDAAKKRIEQARERLVKGESFAALAKEMSDCTSAANDGELGRIEPGYMPEAFDKVAFSLPLGEISPIVQTPFGFHVLQVQDRYEGGVPSYELMRDFLHRALQKQLREERLAQEISALRRQAKIEILLPEAPSESRPTILDRSSR